MLTLSLIIPAYNPPGGIAKPVEEWLTVLAQLKIDAELRVYDDGSTDETAAELATLNEQYPQVVAIHHENRGHGPTILSGYTEAQGEWIFQADSDHAISPDYFAAFWEARHEANFIIGYRENREEGAARRTLSWGARFILRLLFGPEQFRDPNCPFRLMRRELVQPVISKLPDETFAPNLILSGYAAREEWSRRELPVSAEDRPSVTSALKQWRLVKTATLCTRQVWHAARIGKGS
jgi:glycosyltransferase involved in cell wall biosynthesis